MQLIEQKCPICNLMDQEVSSDSSDKVTMKCNRCGQYTITGTASVTVNNLENLSQLSAWLKERNLLNIGIPLLDSNFLKNVIKTLPKYTPSDKQSKLLKAIEIKTDYPGKKVYLVPELDITLSWANNEEEFKYYVKSLIERGLINLSKENDNSLDSQSYPVYITAKGWEFLDADKSNFTSKTQAFVAMSFNKELFSVYENAIEPAIENSGYKPMRIDTNPHLDRIDAKIISEIKNSKFIVADVTEQKCGVYYEAGFGAGLGIPVIWCVRSDDLKNVHFDTRQYNHIIWKNEEELKTKLYDLILATIGKKET